MTAVSYVIIFAFHPHLQIYRVIIELSFGHLNLQLYSLNYLTSEQLKFKEINLLKQFRDCALSVASKRNKLAISEMFCIELKIASDCLMKWFNSKFKIGNMQLSNQLEINPTTSDTTKEKMSYSDLAIAKEQKFLRNIFSEDELSSSDALKNVRSYHEHFSRFLRIVVYLQSLNSIQEFADCVYDNLI